MHKLWKMLLSNILRPETFLYGSLMLPLNKTEHYQQPSVCC